ncbi:hypothetical protein SLS53_000595 [Cytospora paraplurivora]|uniref:Uncharacterized protein n=1 Tax=Cytospora paraplurivora TaxID=2898453 RepID=A0AAN9UI90_9PEZI
MHPVSRKPKQYYMLLDVTSVREIAYLPPQTGDGCKILLPGVQVHDQSNPNAPPQTVEERIARYIRLVSDEETDEKGFTEEDLSLAVRGRLHCFFRGDYDQQNIVRMNNSFDDLLDRWESSNDDLLIDWAKGNMDWLRPPPSELGSVDGGILNETRSSKPSGLDWRSHLPDPSGALKKSTKCWEKHLPKF